MNPFVNLLQGLHCTRDIHSLKLTMDGGHTTFLLGPGLFSGAMLVSGRVYVSRYVSDFLRLTMLDLQFVEMV